VDLVSHCTLSSLGYQDLKLHLDFAELYDRSRESDAERSARQWVSILERVLFRQELDELLEWQSQRRAPLVFTSYFDVADTLVRLYLEYHLEVIS
jgi:hypothetical protein